MGTGTRSLQRVVGMTDQEAEQRRRIRRNAILLGVVALLFYLGFILATGLRS